jgi:hypothetical protein
MKLLILVLLVALVFADSCGGNCPSGKCPTCYCGNTKSVQDIAAWCGKYSWNQACCKCIVSHESGGNAHAINHNTNGSDDVGLWQINTVNNGLFRSTGDSAVAERLPATHKPTSTAPLRSTDGEETPGSFGAPTLHVAADLIIIHLKLKQTINPDLMDLRNNR